MVTPFRMGKRSRPAMTPYNFKDSVIASVAELSGIQTLIC